MCIDYEVQRKIAGIREVSWQIRRRRRVLKVMTKKINVLLPTAEEFIKDERVAVGAKFSDIRGKRIVLLDDGRPNAGVALASLRQILIKDYGCEAFIIERPNWSSHLSPDFNRVGKVDAAVLAISS
jgi:hypothetical protein